MLTQTHRSSVSIKEAVLNARKKMKNLFRNLIYIFIVLEAAGQNVSSDIIDKDQDDIVTQQKIKNENEINYQCQVLSEEMKEMREFKDRIKKDFTEAKATIRKQEDQICKLEEKNIKHEKQLNKMEQLLQDLVSRGKDQNDQFHKMSSNKHLFQC